MLFFSSNYSMLTSLSVAFTCFLFSCLHDIRHLKFDYDIITCALFALTTQLQFTMSSLSDSTLGGHATLSAIAALGNPRYPPSSTKKLVLDAQIYLGSAKSEQLTGVVSYFNLANLNIGLNDVALYYIECTVRNLNAVFVIRTLILFY